MEFAIYLNMVHTGQVTDIAAVQNNLVLQLIHVLLNLVVFHHDNNDIRILKELIKIVILIFYDVLLYPWVKHFERLCQMACLEIEKL